MYIWLRRQCYIGTHARNLQDTLPFISFTLLFFTLFMFIFAPRSHSFPPMNRPEWAAGAYATFGLGGQFVPMYEQQHPDDWGYIVGDSGARIVLVSRRNLVDKV